MQRFLILGLVIVLSLVGGRAEGNDLENAFVTFAAFAFKVDPARGPLRRKSASQHF